MRPLLPLLLGSAALASSPANTSPVDRAAHTFTHPSAQTAVFVDQGRVLAMNSDEGAVVDFSSSRAPHVVKVSGKFRYPRVTVDGRVLALQLDFDRCRVVVWDLGKARAITALRGDFTKVFGCDDPFGTEFFFSTQFTPDGRFLLTLDSAGLRRWDARTGHLLRFRPGTFLTLSVSPDGRSVAALGGERRIELWTADLTRRLKATAPQPQTCLRGGMFPSETVWSPGSTHLAFSCDQDVRVWNVRTGGLRSLKRAGQREITDAPLFSPDGRFVVSDEDGGGVTVWNTDSGQRVGRVGPLKGGVQVTDVRITPAHLLLAALSDGRVARLDLAQGARPLPPLNLFSEGRSATSPGLWPSLAVSPDGSRLAVAAGDGRVMSVPLPLPENWKP